MVNFEDIEVGDILVSSYCHYKVLNKRTKTVDLICLETNNKYPDEGFAWATSIIKIKEVINWKTRLSGLQNL